MRGIVEGCPILADSLRLQVMADPTVAAGAGPAAARAAAAAVSGEGAAAPGAAGGGAAALGGGGGAGAGEGGPAAEESVPGGGVAAPAALGGGQQAAPPGGGQQAAPPGGGQQAAPPGGGQQAAPPGGGQQAAPLGGGQQAAPPGGGTPPQNPAHEEIQSIVWITKNDNKDENEEHRAAVQEWDRKEKYLSIRVDRKEKRSADLTNQIFNIVGFFSVFQGVVLTAVSQLKSGSAEPLCGMVWVPTVLSSLACAVAIFGVFIKFSSLAELELSIFNEKSAQKVVASRVTRLRRLGQKFDFARDAADRVLPLPEPWIGTWEAGILISVCLFVFTCLFVLSYVVILCHRFEIDQWNPGFSASPPTSR